HAHRRAVLAGPALRAFRRGSVQAGPPAGGSDGRATRAGGAPPSGDVAGGLRPRKRAISHPRPERQPPTPGGANRIDDGEVLVAPLLSPLPPGARGEKTCVSDRVMSPSAAHHVWQVRDRTLTIGVRPLVMGIVNVTPDSFSDGGLHAQATAAVVHGL